MAPIPNPNKKVYRDPSNAPRRAMRRASWFAVVLGVVLLGYVGFSYVDAEVYQAYAGWRLDQAIASTQNTSASAQPRSASAPKPPAEVDRVIAVPGSALGRIEINRIGVSAIIVEGVDRKALRRGVGHITGTAFPGEQGNVVLAGHRDTFFRALNDIHAADEITLTTADGTSRYLVDSTKVLTPKDVYVMNGSRDSILTLVTCYPFGYIGPAPKRFIVRASRIQD